MLYRVAPDRAEGRAVVLILRRTLRGTHWRTLKLHGKAGLSRGMFGVGRNSNFHPKSIGYLRRNEANVHDNTLGT